MKTKSGRELTLGSDIEGHLWHKGKRQVIPATAFNTPFTKEKRKEWDDGTGSYHRDNILVEFQTPVCVDWKTLKEAALVCDDKIRKEYEDLGIRVLYSPLVRFKDKGMVEIDEAAEMGCEPDIDAYSGEEQEGPDAIAMGDIRVASGHIHIGGVSDFSKEQQCILVQWLDLLVGLPMACAEVEHYGDAYRRRQYYGQAGRFRSKPYGVEYRTPSNSWLGRTMDGYEDERDYTNLICAAVELTDRGYRPVDMGVNREQVAGAINGPTAFIDGTDEEWWGATTRQLNNYRNLAYELVTEYV